MSTIRRLAQLETTSNCQNKSGDQADPRPKEKVVLHVASSNVRRHDDGGIEEDVPAAVGISVLAQAVAARYAGMVEMGKIIGNDGGYAVELEFDGAINDQQDALYPEGWKSRLAEEVATSTKLVAKNAANGGSLSAKELGVVKSSVGLLRAGVELSSLEHEVALTNNHDGERKSLEFPSADELCSVNFKPDRKWVSVDGEVTGIGWGQAGIVRIECNRKRSFEVPGMAFERAVELCRDHWFVHGIAEESDRAWVLKNPTFRREGAPRQGKLEEQ